VINNLQIESGLQGFAKVQFFLLLFFLICAMVLNFGYQRVIAMT